MIALPDAFDNHLCPHAAAPIAVAYSGGGDSLMALKLTKAWADRHGRRVVALTVDHGLQASSGDWTRAAQRTAERLGVDFRALAWTGEKPETGLPAAARAARHSLIAEAARALGVRVAVFGHTADDVIEAELMRAEGLRVGKPRVWAPSPAWPQGRGVFLLRPLLGLRREAIRQTLTADGEAWIDDPANESPASPRARVRPAAGRSPAPDDQDGTDTVTPALAQAAVIEPSGAIRLPRQALRNAPFASVLRVLGAGLTCAGGGSAPPRGRLIEALAVRLLTAEGLVATLGGAQVLAQADVLIVRDAGEFRRKALGSLSIPARGKAVWDGRFEIIAGAEAITVLPLAGRMKSLSVKALEDLRRLDAAERRALPLILTPDGTATCPILARLGFVGAEALVGERFFSACGVYSREPAT